jgi:hypothetical protein
MIETLLLPFTYSYMFDAMWVSALVGGVCAFLSAYLMLKGWSLIGDALSHSIVPGVALRAGSICGGRFGGGRDVVFEPAFRAERGHDHRPDFHVVLWFGPVYGVFVADICQRSNDYDGQYFGDYTV